MTAIDAGAFQPVSLGAGGFAVSHVEFPLPANGSDGMNTRERCIAVVVEGSVRKRFAGRVEDARGGDGGDDARRSSRTRICSATVVLGSLSSRGDDRGVTALACFRDWEATLLAFRIARELGEPDPLHVTSGRGPRARTDRRGRARADLFAGSAVARAGARAPCGALPRPTVGVRARRSGPVAILRCGPGLPRQIRREPPAATHGGCRLEWAAKPSPRRPRRR